MPTCTCPATRCSTPAPARPRCAALAHGTRSRAARSRSTPRPRHRLRDYGAQRASSTTVAPCLLFANRDEAAVLTGTRDPTSAVRGARAALRRGDRQARRRRRVLVGRATRRQVSPRPRCRRGRQHRAGDAFAAGVLAARLAGPTRSRRPSPRASARGARGRPRRRPAVSLRRPERMARHGFVDRPCRDRRRGRGAHGGDPGTGSRPGAARRPGARGRDLTEADVDAAIADRSVVRTWLMRSTIHLVAADDLRFLVRELGPMIRRRFAKRWAELGLTPDLLARAEAARARAARRAARCTRHEFADGLRARGVAVGERSGADARAGSPRRPPDSPATPTATGSPSWPTGCPAPPTDRAATRRSPSSPGATSGRSRRPRRPTSRPGRGCRRRRRSSSIRDELTPVEVNGRPGYRLGEPARRHRGAAAQRLRQLADRLPRPRRSGARASAAARSTWAASSVRPSCATAWSSAAGGSTGARRSRCS